MKHRRTLTHPATLTIVTDALGTLPILTCSCHAPLDQAQAAHYSRSTSDAIDYGRSMARRSHHTITSVRIVTSAPTATNANHKVMVSA